MVGLILAGGENKRIPFKKGFLKINNKNIIELNIEALKHICNRVVISTNAPEKYFYLGIPMIGDIVKSQGPMTGIFSALSLPEISSIFVIACDMPYINVILLEYIFRKYEHPYDAVVPMYNKEPQPLLSIYSDSVVSKIRESIRQKNTSMRGFLKKINVLYISEEEVRDLDPDGRSFVNINTLEDYHREIGGELCLV